MCVRANHFANLIIQARFSHAAHQRRQNTSPAALLRLLRLDLHLHDVRQVIEVILLLRERLLQRLEVRADVVDLGLVVLRRLRASLQCGVGINGTKIGTEGGRGWG